MQLGYKLGPWSDLGVPSFDESAETAGLATTSRFPAFTTLESGSSRAFVAGQWKNSERLNVKYKQRWMCSPNAVRSTLVDECTYFTLFRSCQPR